MAVYKIFPNKDASIYSRYPSLNAGRDEILEISVKNNTSIAGTSDNVGSTALDDIRRTLISFSDTDISTIKSFNSSSFSANLRLFLASAENLSQDYSVECYPVTQSWVMGTGKFNDNPTTVNGVCWSTVGPISSSVKWAEVGNNFSYLFSNILRFQIIIYFIIFFSIKLFDIIFLSLYILSLYKEKSYGNKKHLFRFYL